MLLHSLLLMFAVFQVQGMCPDGFFNVTDSPTSKCFKLYNVSGSWGYAESYCPVSRDGLPQQLATIPDPFTAVLVREHLVRIGASYRTWIGARGTGVRNGDGRVAWAQDNATLPADNYFAWYPKMPGVLTSTDSCLALLSDEGNLNGYPNQPLYMVGCQLSYNFLCELIGLKEIEPATTTTSTRRIKPSKNL